MAKATTNIKSVQDWKERLGDHLQENEMSLEKQALILKFEGIGGKQQQEGKSKKDQVTEEMFWDIYLGIRPESRL